MKYLTVLTFFITLSVSAQKETPLLGACSPEALQTEPYANWYKPGYENYQPNATVVDQLKKIKPEKAAIKIVFGSWCGDSKREVPRMVKTLHAAGFTDKNIQLLGVSSHSEVYKQAPNREEKELNVYRVPTFIVYLNNKEIGRINEYPVESLERDLQKIISGQPYTPSYRSFPQINNWLAQGLLADENASPRGLADQIRGNINSESELNSCGYVLMARGNLKEAITVFRTNVYLYPQSSNCFDSLGEAYAKAGLNNNALFCYERAVELDPKNENAIAQLSKLKEVNKCITTDYIKK
jgi:tetratricopeptide (TPR) repeat protein